MSTALTPVATTAAATLASPVIMATIVGRIPHLTVILLKRWTGAVLCADAQGMLGKMDERASSSLLPMNKLSKTSSIFSSRQIKRAQNALENY